MKRFFAISFTLIMIFSACFSVAYAIDFPDIASDHWAYEYVKKLTDEGIINGYSDGTFKPNGTIKRGEFLKLVIATTLPEDIEVEEIPKSFEHWAGGYVFIAEMYGVINEGDFTLENIEEPITRVEMARIIANADLYMKENDMERPEESVLFIDIGNVNPMDVTLIEHCVARGLIKGYEDGTFKPEKSMSRAEAATMIYRFYGFEV